MTPSTLTTNPNPSSPAPRSRASTARSALGLLRERAWIGALIGVVLISVVFVFLGRWQYHRHESRSARNHLVNTNYAAAPVALSALLPTLGQDSEAPLPTRLQWRPVRLSGSYLTDHTVLLRNRPQPSGGQDDDGTGAASANSQNGYEVEVPFRTTEGPVVLIDRGWIPAGTSSAARPDSVPAPPSGDVQVIARLHQSEPGSSHQAPPGQANRLDVPRLAAALGSPDAEHVIGAFGLLVSESPAASGTPIPISKPDPGLGINFAYAVQWVAFAIAAYVMLAVAMVREVRRRDLEDADPAPSAARTQRSRAARSRYGLAR
jgi:cytochrome oxidase assembly protein ShyY1